MFARNPSLFTTSERDKDQHTIRNEKIDLYAGLKREEGFLTNFHSDILSAISIILSVISLILSGKLTLEYRKMQVLLGSYLLLQKLDSAKGLPLEWNDEGKVDKVICHDPQVSILLSVMSVLGTILILLYQCRNGKFCKGYMYSSTFVLKLVLSNNIYYVPLKLRAMAGQLHRVNMNTIMHSCQLKLHKNFLWDAISISWNGIQVNYDGERVDLPATILVPFKDKIRTRYMFSKGFGVSIAVCQGSNWYDLSGPIKVPPPGNPISQPSQQLLDPRPYHNTTPTAPYQPSAPPLGGNYE